MRGVPSHPALGLPILLLLAACGESPHPAEPSLAPGSEQRALSAGSRQILMLDQCDPDSFNEVIGPETCVGRNGGITFATFIAQLEKNQTVESWRFSPGVIQVPETLTLPVVNRGGEVHTFTEVEEFGGGIVPLLNALSGTPVPAPECLALGAADFVPAGGHVTHTFEPGERDRYQCCIHPWMRAESR